MTVAPVVVNPDIDSNQELIPPRAISTNAAPSVNGPTNIPPNQNGKHPMNTARGHTRATAAKASLSRNLSLVFVLVHRVSMVIPRTREIKLGIAKEINANSIESKKAVAIPDTASGSDNAISVHPNIMLNTSVRIAITP
jgi:hypothetical protein